MSLSVDTYNFQSGQPSSKTFISAGVGGVDDNCEYAQKHFSLAPLYLHELTVLADGHPDTLHVVEVEGTRRRNSAAAAAACNLVGM